jgi:hypothetical protein
MDGRLMLRMQRIKLWLESMKGNCKWVNASKVGQVCLFFFWILWPSVYPGKLLLIETKFIYFFAAKVGSVSAPRTESWEAYYVLPLPWNYRWRQNFETDSDIESGSVQALRGERGHVIVHPLMSEIRGYFGSRLDCAHMPCSNVGHGFELGLHTSTSSGVLHPKWEPETLGVLEDSIIQPPLWLRF